MSNANPRLTLFFIDWPEIQSILTDCPVELRESGDSNCLRLSHGFLTKARIMLSQYRTAEYARTLVARAKAAVENSVHQASRVNGYFASAEVRVGHRKSFGVATAPERNGTG